MAENVSKKKKSKKARKKAARRLRLIRDGLIYFGIMALCIGALMLMPYINREREPENTWYVQTQGIEIAAPALNAPNAGADTLSADTAPDADFDLAAQATPEPTPTPAPTPTPEPTPVIITISAAGDCTLGGSVNTDTYKDFKQIVEQNGYDYFFSNVRHVFRADDLTIVNLEGPLTDVGKGHTGSYCFKGDPDYVQILSGSSIELCNVANNHSRDFGTEGLVRTAEVLEGAGIGCCGYTKVYTNTIKGVRITALGFDKWTHKQEDIVSAIQQERPNCDILIVNIHWGRERVYEPMTDQVKWGHAAIDAGADLVLGTHPHVIGGIEQYNGKYIVYSLGNFCFGGNNNPKDKRTLIFQQSFVYYPDGHVTDGGINVIPCSISSVGNKNDLKPTILHVEEGSEVLKAIAKYSNISTNGTLWMKNSYLEQVGLMVVLPRETPLPRLDSANAVAEVVVEDDVEITEETANLEEPEVEPTEEPENLSDLERLYLEQMQPEG